MVQRWNTLEARLELDEDARVHSRVAPRKSAELGDDLARAGSSLHTARRALEHMYLTLPEHARLERLELASEALDDAEAAVSQADAIRASAEPPATGAPPVLAPPAASSAAAPVAPPPGSTR